MAIFTTRTIGALAVAICALTLLTRGSNASERSAVQQEPATNNPVRTWSDSSGRYRIEGSFIGYTDGRVSIRKPDGSEISVLLDKLSESDGKYVRLKLRSGWPTGRDLDMSDVSTEADKRRREAADELVRQAIIADLEGQSAQRKEMLAMAVDKDPEFGPARWLSGQVRNSQNSAPEDWLSVEQAEQLSSADPLLAEYARRRDDATDDSKSQEVLALWCRKQGLNEQEKIHWWRVLDADPSHRSARRCLQLQEYNGRLLTREQIAEAKEKAVVLEKKRKQWMPKLNEWRRAIQSNDLAEADAARREMEELRDPDLVGLLESYLSPRSEQLSLAVVESLGNIPEQTAAHSLVRHAVKSKWSGVRRAAAEQLQDRPKYSYVPLLINAMAAPLKFSSWMEGTDIGYSVEQEGRAVDHVLQGTVDVRAVPDLTDNSRETDYVRSIQAAERAKEARAREVARELEDYVDRKNQAAAKLNEPIRQALTITTGQNFGLDPSAWNDWWNDYNENESVNKVVMTARRYDRAYAEYTPVQGAARRPERVTQGTRGEVGKSGLTEAQRLQVAGRIRAEEAQTRAREESERRRQESIARREERAARRAANPCECFPAGTPVRTQSGQRPIEAIQIGDLVLSQNPDTGELAYKPVIRTTVRPANKLVDISMGGETLRTTKGHPMWVGGQGWLIAKYIQPGDRLHRFFGSIEVEAIREVPVKENVYNLVVDDFHSYFVGENSVLVHDNSVITPPSVTFLGEKLVAAR